MATLYTINLLLWLSEIRQSVVSHFEVWVTRMFT